MSFKQFPHRNFRSAPSSIDEQSVNISRPYERTEENLGSSSTGYKVYTKGDVKPIYEQNLDQHRVTSNHQDHADDGTSSYYIPSSGHNSAAEWNDPTKAHHSPDELTSAIASLDRLLRPLIDADSYNTSLHPPVNPVLALILSRYGRYVPGTQNPRVYSYMASNNIHNNKPFGKYKHSSDEETGYY